MIARTTVPRYVYVSIKAVKSRRFFRGGQDNRSPLDSPKHSPDSARASRKEPSGWIPPASPSRKGPRGRARDTCEIIGRTGFHDRGAKAPPAMVINSSIGGLVRNFICSETACPSELILNMAMLNFGARDRVSIARHLSRPRYFCIAKVASKTCLRH
jgi:hypothetical protein